MWRMEVPMFFGMASQQRSSAGLSGGGSAGSSKLQSAASSRTSAVVAAPPRRCRWSATQLPHDTPPECGRLSDARIAGLLADRGVDHDEPAGRIDEDRLAAYAEQREHPPLPWEDPDLIAVAEGRRRGAGPEVRLVRGHTRGVLDPRDGNDLPAPPIPVVSEQQAESRVVAQDRVDAAERHFLTRAVDEPGRVGFSTDRRPDLLLQVVSDRSPDRAS